MKPVQKTGFFVALIEKVQQLSYNLTVWYKHIADVTGLLGTTIIIDLMEWTKDVSEKHW